MGLVQAIIKRLTGSNNNGMATFEPTYADWIDATVTISDLVKRYGSLPKATQLLRYFVSCSEASTCAVLKANYLAQFQPRLYRRGTAPTGKGFSMRQKRVTDRKILRRLKDSSPTNGVGSVARYASNAGDDVYEVVDHPFIKLMYNPNPYEPYYLFWQMSHLQRQIFGNAYAVGFFGSDGLPEQMRHMAAQNVRICPSRDNFIESFEYKVGSNTPDYYAAEVVSHFKAMSSVVDYYYGQSWLERCGPDMDLIISSKAADKYRFDRGMRIDFAVMMPEYNPVQKEETRKEIEMRGTGVRNTGGFIIMPGASTITALTMNNRDAQKDEAQSRAAKNIRFCAGVPEAIANGSESNLAGSLMADGVFKQITIQPELGNDAQQRTKLLCDWYGHAEGDIWCAYDDIVNIGAEENADATIKLWQANMIQLDEARSRINYDPDDTGKGDLYFAELTAAAQPAPLVDTGGEHPITPMNQARADAGEKKPQPEDNNYKALPEVPVEIDIPVRKQIAPAVEKKVVSVKALWESHRTKSDAWEYPFSRKAYAAVNAGVESWYKDGVESGHFEAAKLQKGLEPLAGVFQEGGQDGLAQVMSVAGGAERVAELGVSFDVLAPEVMDFISGHYIRLAHEINAKKNLDLAEAIRASIAEGDNTQEATKKVLAAYKELTTFEAERIARTESTVAYMQGSKKSWEASGVTQKVWSVAGGPCELCDVMNQKYASPVPMDQLFFKLGDTLTVGSKVYTFDYENVDAPPLHPSCRCTLLPVI